MFAKNVLEGGDVYPVGVAPLFRLLELLWIAEQHDTSRGLGDGEHVSQ